MIWLFFLADSPGVTPVDTFTGSITSYILGFGPLGIVAIAFAFGWILPRGAVKQAREQGRQDLARENERLIAEKKQAEEQRDAAMQITQEKLLPMLISFTSASSALIPLLQQLVADQEARRGRSSRERP